MNTNPSNDASAHIFNALLKLRDDLGTYANVPVLHFLEVCRENSKISKSQLFQDLFVLFFLNGKRNGVFVEFGAADGVNLSNSYMLETQFGWKGILAEPAKDWHARIRAARTAVLETRCVWSKTGEHLQFRKTPDGELSTLEQFANKDGHREGRVEGKAYEVETISLNDMLKNHNCPQDIDYMSVDTEGSELEILSAFDFSKYNIKIMTVAHNYTEGRAKLRKLLAAQGFYCVLDNLSKHDDWFVQEPVLQAMEQRLGLK
jgi:FkbM family methyltransferase